MTVSCAGRNSSFERPQKLSLVYLGRFIDLKTATQDSITYTSPRISFMIHALASINWHCSEDSIENKLIYFPLSIWDLVLDSTHTHREKQLL